MLCFTGAGIPSIGTGWTAHIVTASETVQKERDTILQSQGITPIASTRNTLYSQKNLLQAGSGCLAKGADAAQQIANTASSLNVPGFTASTLMSLMHKNEKKNNAR